MKLPLTGHALTACLLAFATGANAAETSEWSGAAPKVSIEDADNGYSRIVSEECFLTSEAVGHPALPIQNVLFDVPANADVCEISSEVKWETLASGVRVIPVLEPVRGGEEMSVPVPNEEIYGGTSFYPSEPAAGGPFGMVNGKKILPVTVTPFRWHPVSGLLERASSITVKVTFKSSVAIKPRMSFASVRPVCLPSVAAAEEKGLYRTDTATNAFDYLLVAPPDFYDDWCWYVRQRKNTHKNLRFAVKNTAAIYADYPFGKDRDCRNAAESIHAYLRQAVSNGLQYVVLGGAWLDAQNLNNYTPYFVSGEAMSLSNCVPGIYGFPRENWRQIPADLFYGCLDMAAGQKYPWDRNGDGKYIDQSDCQYNDTYPDIIVSRITLNPHNPRSGAYNQHALITNYVDKLARGENRYFAGHFRYGMSVASTGSSKLRKTGDRMQYRELEFYDGMYNMFDPRHHDSLEDGEGSTRLRYYEQFSMWRPIRSVKGMMSYTWTQGLPNLSAAMDDYYAGDRDFGYVQAHGWAQGAAQFSAYRFAMATGLTLFNGGSGPCETGYPDYHVSSGGKKVLQYNVGDAAVTNPDGGALASVNNSRWSWAGGGGGFAAMSYYMLNEMLIGFNGDRMDVGHAWLKGVRNYWPAGRWGSTAGWVLTEQFLYGDPLVRLPELPHVWWTGGEKGVWDRTTENWTNNVDTAKTFDAASNVYFNVEKKLELDVADEIAAMRLSIPAWQEDAVITLAGTGTLRVMQSVDVAATNSTLKFNVAGGVGHDGIRFVTGAGDLVFEGTNKFYVGGVKNAKSIALNGGGVTLDVDEFAAGTFPIAIDGSREPLKPLPNELRSKNVGGLKRFGSLAITNSHVKLSTVDAFGNDKPMTHALVDSELEIAANVYYQRSGFPEGLNATILVDGDSEVSSSEGGLWTVKHTTTFVLGAGAARSESAPYCETHLTLGAETVNAGGKIVITNAQPSSANVQLPTNTVTIANASALSGEVAIGAGIRLVLKELPLKSVTSLTIGEGATIELPDDESGYWQIVPVSSKFTCPASVRFVAASAPETQLAGSSSKTGAFFREGALYSWTGKEGDWNTFFANRHPKILFGDIYQLPSTIFHLSSVTVNVAAAVSPEFAFFSNLKTKYVFAAANESASVLFDSVYFSGPVEFDAPVGATEYVEVSFATSRFSNVTAPYVHVSAGAGLALAGSHWTEFRLDADATLVAVPGETLDWNAQTQFEFPDEGSVLIDVSALALSDEPIALVTGCGHEWTLADLKKFKLVQSKAELRIVDGALCVVRGDDIDGPYELDFVGETNWNCSAWTATNAAVGGHAGRMTLPAVWNECALDWTADAVVTVTNVDAIETIASTKLAIDCDVHVQTLTIHAGTNDFNLACDNSTVDLLSRPTFSLATLDLTDCHGTTDIEVDLGTAEILTASSTNGTDVVHLYGTGSGTIDLEGITLIVEQPGDWTLTAGAQGVLRVRAPQAYERFRIAKVPSDFKTSALTVQVMDAHGNLLSGFATSVADGGLWCEPPALEAVVPSGTNDLTRLEWRDVLGNVVSNVDWNQSAGFKLIGTETSGVVIAKNGFESIWSRLSVSNTVTIYGNETFSPSSLPGPGTLSLAGAFTLKVNVRASTTLLTGSHLELKDESTLEISHGGENFDATAQNWSGITGTGRVKFTDDTSHWLIVPGNLFAPTLRVETASEIGLCQTISPSNPFGVVNLAGAGTYRVDWASGSDHRPVSTVQTGVSEWSGSLKITGSDGSRHASLNVASDAPEATTNKALIVSGTTNSRTLNIATNGCVILTGAWTGPINVSGILVITNAAATNGVEVKIAEGGKIQLASAAELPAVTAAEKYVAPTYPDDPDTPEEKPSVDERVRILTAAVGVGGRGVTALPWTSLEWCDTNGVVQTAIDWAIVTNVTIVATNESCRVVFDAEAFSGVVRIGRAASPVAAALTIESRKRCPFTLAADSVGAIDFRLDPEPTASCELLYIASESQPSTSTSTSISISVHNRYGSALSAAGEVEYDAANGKYYLNVQNVNAPTYNCKMDSGYEDSITGPLWFNGSGNLTYAARPEFFEASRDGRALIGTSMNHFSMHSHNGNPTVGMDNIYVWSLNFVAKLPTNNGGIIFGWGNKDSGNGVAFVRVSENRAGVYAWQNGGGVWLVASANVPFASTQFHSYAITHDSHTLCFYVDGVLAQSASLEGKYPTRGFYQWFKMYGQNGGLQNGPTSVVDDFRLYVNTCLTATSVKKIADDFPPWPEHPTAEVDVEDLAWTNLYWSAAYGTNEALSVVAGAGSLKFDAPVTVTNAISVTGGTVPLRLVKDGEFVVRGGLAVSSVLEIDASGLDGTNLASYAVADVPYSRWLVRGTYSGSVAVTALPEVPEGYAVRVEQFANLGIRLVFTAPRYAFADALGISVGPDTFDGLSGTIGLHPTSPTNWYAYANWDTNATAVGGVTVVGSEGGKVDEQRPYGEDNSVPRYFWRTSFDGSNDTFNGKSNGLTLKGLSSRFDKYRVLVYLATDTTGANFGPVTIAGRTYCGLSAGSESESATVADSTATAWGKAKVTTAEEGVNVVISDVLSENEIAVSALRLKNGNTYARGQIAAIEIVRVGEIHEFTGSRYSAEVAGDTNLTNGNGSGLENHTDWKNGEFSSICLTAKVAKATLTFETAVTAETFKVVTAADQELTLARDASMAVYAYDLSESRGTVRMKGGLHLGGAEGAHCVLAAAPKGTLDIIVDNVETNQRLMKLAADFDCNVTDFAATVHFADGTAPGESWVVLPLDGWLVLQCRDIEKPWYSLTFEGDLTKCIEGSTAVPLSSEGSPKFVEIRDGKQAMTGGTPYSSSDMTSVPAAWTIHAVAEMPKESNGILFGYGRQGQRGVGLVTVDADHVAVAWWDSRGKFTVINAAVTNATCQYHAYAIVSTGTRVSLYVDGEFKGRSDVAVNPQKAVIQIGSIYGDIVSGFVKTTTGAMDDWRLYDGVLSTNAIKTLAGQFAPWPKYNTATLTETGTVWSNLTWRGDAGSAQTLLLDNRGGTLAVTNGACEVTNELFATGHALALYVAGDGVFRPSAGFTLLNGWTIDCSGLDATNLMNCADAASPYLRWLVEGAYSGDDPMVTGVPTLTARYSIVTVTDKSRGVWLSVSVRDDYVADLTNSTVWASGRGPGLDVKSSADWANDATSTITITQRVDAATLDFDTNVVARLIKLVSTNGQSTVFCDATGAVSIGEFDLSSALGTVTISNDIPSGTTVDLAQTTVFCGEMNGSIGSATEGANVRYEKSGITYDVAKLKYGVTNVFKSATLNGNTLANARLYRVREGDDLRILPTGDSPFRFNGRIFVDGGRLVLDSANASDKFWYGICGQASFTQTGGETVATAKSNATSGNGCFLLGVSGSGNIPFAIWGGTFSILDSPLCFWQHESISLDVGGTGLVKVKGLWGNGGRKGVVTVYEGGTLSVGTLGIANSLKSLTLKGGALTAHANATTAQTITLDGDSTIAADDGVRHVISGALEGNGKLTVGTTNRTGTVQFANVAAFEHAIEVKGGTLDLGTLRPTNAIVRAGGKIAMTLTTAEVEKYANVTLVPLAVGATNADYVVYTPAGAAVESDWVAVSNGWLTVDVAGLDFSDYVMPLCGRFVAGKEWSEQEWHESSAASNRVPSVYWASAANVSVVLDIDTNAVVTAIPSGVTSVTVTGAGTIVSERKWPTFKGLTDEAWRGTVRIANMSGCTGYAGCTFEGLGNANSTVEMDNVTGWFNGLAALGVKHLGQSHAYTLKIGAGGFTMDNGNSNQGYTFARLAGSGTFSVGKGTPTFRVTALDASAFKGRIFVIDSAGVTLGTPTKNPVNGQLVVATGAKANVTAGESWSVSGGFEVMSGATLNMIADGAAPNYTVTSGELTLQADAHLSFNDGADVFRFWYAEGGDIVRADEWTGELSVATNYTAKTIVVAKPTILALSGEGCVSVSRKLDASAAKLTIDASGIDGTNIAKYAVAGAPYSHWIVTGPVSGEISVSKLPKMPVGYSVKSEVLSAHGVRLVVTANGVVKFGAISVNLYQDATLGTSDATSGLYPVARKEWGNLQVKPGESVTVSNATFKLGSGVTAYKINNAPPDDIYRQYMDDSSGRTSELTISGIDYAAYRIIVYYSTDTKDVTFRPLVVNDVYYAASPSGSTSAIHTIKGLNAAWGNTGPEHQALDPAEGVNALVTDVLTGSSATIKAIRPNGDAIRATIAAIQVVKVGQLYGGDLQSSLGYPLPGTETIQTYNYFYHPSGTDDGKWETATNWASATVWQRQNGAVETNYTAYAGEKSPYVGCAYLPVAIVAHEVTTESLDGWNERIGLYEGATLTVKRQKKFQSDANTKMFVAVDDTSRYTIESWGDDSYERSVDFYIAAPSGLVVKAKYGEKAEFDYHLAGVGSVCFEAGFTGTHVLKSATVELGEESWTEKRIAKKYLVIGDGAVATNGSVAVAGGVKRQTGDAAVTTDDAVGTYRIGRDEKGTFIEWVARKAAEILEVHPSETGEDLAIDDTNKVKIVCVVTNGTDEIKVDLTSAFTLETVGKCVRATLNPMGEVSVPSIGSNPSALVVVTPELSTLTDDEHVAESPFALTDDGVAVGVKAIPGLRYRLLRGTTPAGAKSSDATEVDSTRAENSLIKLSDPARPADSAFYIIRVSR